MARGGHARLPSLFWPDPVRATPKPPKDRPDASMTRIKRPLIALLRRMASWIIQHRYLRHVAFRILGLLPRPVQARLRRLATPGSHIAPPSPGGGRTPYLLSPRAERLYIDLKARQRTAPNPAPNGDPRPRLAFVSPLPPERTGIADYSAELLAALACHYRIEVVVDQQRVTHPWIDAHCPIRDVAWFREHAGEFDRVVYQFGNSLFHAHMFALLEEIPGVVVLHDFYLSHVVANLDAAHPEAGFLPTWLYRGHGYLSLKDYANGRGVQQVIWDFPCNLPVLTDALGVIVHSRHSLALARQFYPALDIDTWSVIPLPRAPAPTSSRRDARQRLGLPENAHLVCSFGHLTSTKLGDRLLDAWLASALAEAEDCWLVFVGDTPVTGLGPVLEARIRDQNLGARIRITGWVDGEHYQLYLQAADVGVQLRARSRGETSAAALDCMNHGLATIINANGSMADLPDDAVVKLADEFSDEELSAALEHLWRDGALRDRLARRARDLVHGRHNPEACAGHYLSTIEQCYGRRATTYLATLDGALTAAGPADDRALATIAADLAGKLPAQRGHRQLFVDVSAMARSDLRTGIERVARAQLLALLDRPPPGFRIEPVYLTELEGHWQYCHARRYTTQLLGVQPLALADELIDTQPGDILYIPDFFAAGVIAARDAGLYRDLRARGLTINVLVHDLLPITSPAFFPPGADIIHGRWLAAIREFAHRLICISGAVADEVRALCPPGQALPPIAVLHHGADIDASAPSGGMPRQAKRLLATLSASPTFLMVGTIEPRKGHLQTLDAFELLWRKGLDINLAIVGSEGWKPLDDGQRRTIPEIVRRLSTHPRRERSLFWLSGISDQFLEALYGASTCLIAASEGEGFGLPLIEAAQHQVPLIVRDIPVFREVAGDHAWYFSGLAPEALADAIEAWLPLWRAGKAPESRNLPWRTWADNTQQLCAILLATPEDNRPSTGQTPGALCYSSPLS